MRLNDAADVRAVMDTYAPMLYRLAYVRTGNHHDAEDVCQDVLIALVQKNPEFEREENRRAWLIRAAINRTISLLRTGWHSRVALTEPEKLNARAEIRDTALLDALESLPIQERTILTLSYFDGLKSHEIASALGIRPPTVRKRLSRAREHLKALLDEEV